MKKVIMVIGALVLVLGGLFSLSETASAHGREGKGKMGEGHKERHEAMVQIYENGDFEAWTEMVQDKGRFTEMVNEETFLKMVEAHSLRMEGKFDEARQIMEELGLGRRMGMREGHGRMAGNFQE